MPSTADGLWSDDLARVCVAWRARCRALSVPAASFMTAALAPLAAARLSGEPFRPAPGAGPLEPGDAALAAALAADLARLPLPQACHLAGEARTALMGPEARRNAGAFFTPPPLAARLLDMAEAQGADWTRCRAVDPAAGAGIFLVLAAGRMAAAAPGGDPVADAGRRLRGVELDPLSAWLAQLFVELALAPWKRPGAPWPRFVETGDGLADRADDGSWDLVMGNPPFGRVPLGAALRARFAEGLHQ